jgi:hypothetical protein
MPPLIDLWDRLARKAMGIRPAAEGSALGYTIRRYPGRSLTSDDGVTVRRGEPVIELHLDSRLIREQTAGATAHGRIIYLRREFMNGLRAFAHLVSTDPALAQTRGIWAITLLHRGVDMFGFTVIDLPPSPTRWLTDRYMKMLLANYHPDHDERLHQREEELVSKEIFLSKERLLERYGEGRRKERKAKAGPAE